MLARKKIEEIRSALLDVLEYQIGTKQVHSIDFLKAALADREKMVVFFKDIPTGIDNDTELPLRDTFQKLIDKCNPKISDKEISEIQQGFIEHQKIIIHLAAAILLDEKGQLFKGLRDKLGWSDDLKQYQILDFLCSYFSKINRNLTEGSIEYIKKNEEIFQVCCNLADANYGTWIQVILTHDKKLFDLESLVDIKPLWLIKIIDLPYEKPSPGWMSTMAAGSYTLGYYALFKVPKAVLFDGPKTVVNYGLQLTWKKQPTIKDEEVIEMVGIDSETNESSPTITRKNSQ